MELSKDLIENNMMVESFTISVQPAPVSMQAFYHDESRSRLDNAPPCHAARNMRLHVARSQQFQEQYDSANGATHKVNQNLKLKQLFVKLFLPRNYSVCYFKTRFFWRRHSSFIFKDEVMKI